MTFWFWALAAVSVTAALGMILVRRAVHCAMLLALVMLALAALYALQQAPFLAFVQVIVYTGAVLMLFLFVLMLVGVSSADSVVETIRGQRLAAAVVAIGFVVVVGAGIGSAAIGGIARLDDQGRTEAITAANNAAGGNLKGLAGLIFTKYVFAFEVTGALLITAALGAMVLAHRERTGPRITQRVLARERFRPGGRPTPLPGPGTYAQHNAVDMPALLPDGSPAPESVSAIIVAREERVGEHVRLPPEAADARTLPGEVERGEDR